MPKNACHGRRDIFAALGAIVGLTGLVSLACTSAGQQKVTRDDTERDQDDEDRERSAGQGGTAADRGTEDEGLGGRAGQPSDGAGGGGGGGKEGGGMGGDAEASGGAAGAPDVADAPVPGENWTIEDMHDLEIVWVKPGTFDMGYDQPVGAPHTAAETPRTRVTFSKGFWLSRTEITREQFAAFVEATGYETWAESSGVGTILVSDGKDGYIKDVNWRNALGTDPKMPVTAVDLPDALAFAKWIDERERAAGRVPQGYQYRLPTDAEHEYACLAGNGTNPVEYTSPHHDVRVVTGQEENPWGLVAMSGNVWEWVQSPWTDRYPGGSVTDWSGPKNGKEYTKRAGGRCQERSWMPRQRPTNHLGIRLVLGLDWSSLAEE